MVGIHEKKVLFRKVTELIKSEKLATQKELAEKLGLSKGQFDGLRNGVSVPTSDIFEDLEEMFPGITEKAKENVMVVEEEREEYVSLKDENAALKIENARYKVADQMQRQVIEVLERERKMMEKVVAQLEAEVERLHGEK